MSQDVVLGKDGLFPDLLADLVGIVASGEETREALRRYVHLDVRDICPLPCLEDPLSIDIGREDLVLDLILSA